MSSSKTTADTAQKSCPLGGWFAAHRNGAWYTLIILVIVGGISGLVPAVAHYALTKPFEASDAALEDAKVGAQRALIFPDAKSFEEAKVSGVDGLNKAWKSDSGDYVFDVQSDGYHGAVELMIGITKDGKVAGIQVISENETEGIGTNALTEDYLGSFKDLAATGTLTVKDAGSGETHVDGVSGATFTSTAVANDLNIAFEAYAQLGGN